MTDPLNVNKLILIGFFKSYFLLYSSKLQDGLKYQLKFSFKAQMELTITSYLLNCIFFFEIYNWTHYQALACERRL